MVLERRLLVGAVGAWLVTAIANLATDDLLGYDEAAFATLARGDDMPEPLYRSRGVVSIAQLGLALGTSESALRIPFVVLCIALPLGAFALGRATFGARAGAWAALAVTTGHQLLLRNAHVLGDVPSAAAVLLGLAVLVHELPREDGARWRVVLAAPAFAFAFYVRYGSVPVIALALGLAPIVWWRAVVARPWRVLAMYAMFAAFLVPHAMHAVARTGNILGVLRDAAGVPHRAHIGEGLVTYLTSNPFTYYGVVLAPCMLVGLLGVIRAPRRPTVFLAIVGVGQLVAIGLTSHGQPRYVFVAVCVLSILGVGALHPDMRPRTALAICAIAWVVALVWNVRAHTVSVRTRASIVVAARAIEHDRQRPCTVIASSLYQVLWYTRCAGYDHVALTPRAFRADHTRYLVHTAVGPIELAAFVDDHRVRVARELATDDPRTRVWVIRGPAD